MSSRQPEHTDPERDDRVLRRVASNAWADDAPAPLGDRVIRLIHHRLRFRRTALAAGATGMAAALLTMVSLTRPDTNATPPTNPLAQVNTGYLASAPPVDTLNLIAEDQTAILEYLQTLGGDLK
ncbi:MAG: hypothetical protein ACYTGQ_15285 [Planctomycetota bacterium]|jgi:hypothetical protein